MCIRVTVSGRSFQSTDAFSIEAFHAGTATAIIVTTQTRNGTSQVTPTNQYIVDFCNRPPDRFVSPIVFCVSDVEACDVQNKRLPLYE